MICVEKNGGFQPEKIMSRCRVGISGL
ncbi:uncharacterized protein METZ01_LOCUS399461, partial [marine metagenome]